MAGKRLRDDPGDWWLIERDILSSRREPWPSRRVSSGASSSCEEENEHQNKHHLLWRHLELSEPYLEPGSGEGSETEQGVESIVVESGGGSKDNITMVEDGVQARGQDGVSTDMRIVGGKGGMPPEPRAGK